MVICIETSTPVCSVSLCDSTGVKDLRENRGGKSHSAQLTLFIDDLLKSAEIGPADLEAVAVSKGPGSYTGLRIGVSVAKGMAFAISIPLIGVETLLSMFHGITPAIRQKYGSDEHTLFCPMIDARRMEVYSAIFDSNGNKVREITAEVITSDSFQEIPEYKRIIFFGDGAAKCKEIINRRNIAFADEFRITAASMQKPVYDSLKERRFEDIAYFEPFYLKDFITTKPVKNISGR